MANWRPRTICSAQMRADSVCVSRGVLRRFCQRRSRTREGFTLAELIGVVVIISLFVVLAQINLFGLLGRNTFKAQIQEFISALQMAASAAAQSDRRYEVVIDLTEQSYLLRQITSPDLSQVLEEEIILENNFSDNCRVAYVEFDETADPVDNDHDVQRGHWSFTTHTFTPNDNLTQTSYLFTPFEEIDANTDFINAVRVRTRRTSIPSFFASFFVARFILVSQA